MSASGRVRLTIVQDGAESADPVPRWAKRRFSVVPTDPAQPYPAAPILTRQEADCLHGVSLGRRNVEIAMALGLTRTAVARLLASARAKLGAKTRSEAAVALGRLTRTAR